jgi:hypothetical protein
MDTVGASCELKLYPLQEGVPAPSVRKPTVRNHFDRHSEAGGAPREAESVGCPEILRKIMASIGRPRADPAGPETAEVGGLISWLWRGPLSCPGPSHCGLPSGSISVGGADSILGVA